MCSQIVNPKGEMKGSAITGPVGKEAAELWPVCDRSHESCLKEAFTNLILYSVSPPTLVSSCEEFEAFLGMGLYAYHGAGVVAT
jgi:hypothetical protein